MIAALLAHAPVLAVAIPMVLAPIVVLIRRGAAGWFLYTAGSAFSLAISLSMLMGVLANGPLSYALGGWPPPFGIEYRIDLLNAVVLSLVSGIALGIAPFAWHAVKQEVSEPRIYLFYACMLLCLTGLLGIAATGDAFNVFVFLEISSLASYALIAMGHSRRSLLAAFQYLVLGTVGGTFILIGVGLLYALTGTLNMADLAERLPAVADSRVMFAACTFILVGFGIKLALFPLHQWQPAAYAEAPSAVSALIAGTASKVAAYGLLRFAYTIIGPETFWTALPLGTVVMLMACAAMLYGSAMAIVQTNTKRLLAWSSVAQIGYIVLAMSLATATGASAALAHIVAHGFAKAGLFVAVGAVILSLGTTRVSALAGLHSRQPLIFAAICVGGLALIGVPGTAGFISKWVLIQALIEAQTWLALGVVLISSLLAVIYVGKLIEAALFHAPADDALAIKLPAGTAVSLLLFSAAVIGFGLFGADLIEVTTAAGAALMGPAP